VRQYLGDQLSDGHLGGQNRSAPKTDLVKACIALSQANLPYRIIVAGDEWVADDLLGADLSSYRAVLRFEPSHLTAEQEARLQTAGDRLVTWQDAPDLLAKLDQDIGLTGADNITVLPRRQPLAQNAPLILHLLNSNYDPECDRFETVRDLRLTFAQSLLKRSFSSAALYAPGKAPVALDCQDTDEETSIILPELGMWGILKLE